MPKERGRCDMSRKSRLALVAVAVVLVLLAGGVMAAIFLGMGRNDTEVPAYSPDGDTVADDAATRPVSPTFGGTETSVEVSARTTRESEALSGEVAYDDIPSPSQIVGGYEADVVRDCIIRHIQESHPMQSIASIQLLGNGVAPSQEANELTSYMCYLVTLDSQVDIGLFIHCSDSTEPVVTEADYLVIDPTLLYDVVNKDYISMEPMPGAMQPEMSPAPSASGEGEAKVMPPTEQEVIPEVTPDGMPQDVAPVV